MKKFYNSNTDKIVFPHLKNALFTFLLLFISSQCEAQYCAASHANAGNCAVTDIITNVKIKGTSLDNSVSTCNGVSRVNSYSATGNTTATLYSTAGYNTYSISVTCSSTDIISLWIDYNQNDTFEASEWKQVATNATANTAATVSFTVPTTALLGQTGMRVRSRLSGNQNGSGDACLVMGSGVTHDYTITIDTLAACSGTPTAGTVFSSQDSICSGTSFSLSINGGSYGAGQTFQWQSSSDTINWVNMNGDTTITINTAITANTYFRFYTECNGNADTSAFKMARTNPFYMCYCIPINNTACAITDMISNVEISGTTLNNIVNSCNSTGNRYNNYTATNNLTGTLYNSSGYNNYTLSVTSTTSSRISVWIDYDHSGTYDASEWTQVTTASTANSASTVSITIPTNSQLGYTSMRIRTRNAVAANGSGNPCTTFTNGITHDYIISIDTITACSGNLKTGSVMATEDKVCPGSMVAVYKNGGTALGSGQTVQWQSSADSLNWSDVNGATSLTLTVTVSAKTYYRYYTVCNGSSSDTSNAKLIDLNPAYLCYCLPTHPSCDATDEITNVTIQGTTLNNTPQSCPTGIVNPYYSYASKGNTTTYLTQGQTYNLDVTTNTNNIISVWFDYDQSGTFDASEWTQVCTTSTANTANTVSITIPSTTPSGKTGMRIRSRLNGNTNGAINACTNFGSGQSHDYIVTIGSPLALDAGVAGVTAPGNIACYSTAEPVSVVIQNYGTDTLDMANNNVKIHVGVSGALSASLDTTITNGKLAPNDTLTVFFTGTLDLSKLNSTYNFLVYTTLNNDSNAFNDSSNFTINTVAPISLDYVENFNNIATIPSSYFATGFNVSAGGGVNGTRGLRLSANNTISVTGVNSPIAGPLTTNSVFKFSFANPSPFDSQDSLLVYLTFDCGKTYNTVYKFDNNNTSSTSYSNFIYDLSAYSGNNVAAVFVSYNNSGNTYSMDFDNIVIADKPTLNLGPDSTSCTGILLNANPKNNNKYSILWSNTTTNNSITANTSGTYWALLTDNNTGLTAVDSVMITINSISVNLGTNKNICNGSNTNLDAGNFGAGTTYLWNTGATTQTISVGTAGTYSVSVKGANGCIGIDSIVVGYSSTNALQGLDISKGNPYNGSFNNGTANNPDAVCVGSSVNYELTPPTYGNSGYGTSWIISSFTFATQNSNNPTTGTYNTSSPSSASNGTFSFTPTNAEADSIYMIMMTIQDIASGCDTSITRYVKVNALPTPSLGSDQTVCPTNSVSLNAGSYVSYIWSDGSMGSSLTTATTGTIWVKVTDANGCSNSDTMNLNNYNVTPVNLGADKTICPSTSVNLDAGTGSSYSWNTGAATQTISASTAGTYFVDVVDVNGCKTRDSITVSLFAAPDASFSSARVNGKNNNVQFTAVDVTAGNIYAWDFGDGNTSNTQNPLHVYTADGSYSVKLTVTNANTCTDAKTVSTVVNTNVVSISNKVNGISVYPNPYFGSTSLNYSLSEATQISIELYDITGRKIATLANAKQSAGVYQLPINTNNQIAGGTYTVRISANGEIISIRVIDIK
ncbi:MAG: GEVED domain-containing protein [Bacteroidota bacterium]|nr:GEVED domain-containing protein [Bacteroidota bacterium]